MILVTGGAGFIGSHLVRRLVADGAKVRVLDDFSSGRDATLAAVRRRIELIRGDVADPAVARRAVRGVRHVYHLAARPSVARSIEDPAGACHANIEGTLQCLLAARDARVDRVVAFSSSSIYGEQPNLPKIESMMPAPLSPYAASKMAGEHIAAVFAAVYGLKVVCLRPFNVYGPGQDPKSQYAAVIPRFVTSVLAGRRPVIYSDGGQTRDFTYVDDVVSAVLAAARKARVFGGAYNIACGRRTSLNTLLATINRLCGTKIAGRYEKVRPGDVRHSQASIAAARRAFGWRPEVTFEEGLRRTIEFYRHTGR